MSELIKNARIGWQDYTEAGKLAALLLIALLIFWFAGKEFRKGYLTLIIYTTVMAVCCICPLTAALLMQYQTRFYDYEWIWSAVPMTIVIALAGTLLWFDLTGKFEKKKSRKWKCAGIAVAMIALVYLCGSKGIPVWDAEKENAELEETAKVLEIITENGQNTDIILWAPQSIMEYARALDGSIRLPYGRNMWDNALNGYSYDVYGDEEKTLYAWMSHAEETGEGEVLLETLALELADSAAEYSPADSVTPKVQETMLSETVNGPACMDLARQLGVTHILLPGNLQQEALAEIEEYLGVQAESVEEYYLLWVQEKGEL